MPEKPNPVMLMRDFLLTSISFWPSPKKFSDSSQQKCSFFFLATPSIFVLHLANDKLLTVDFKNVLEQNVIFFVYIDLNKPVFNTHLGDQNS